MFLVFAALAVPAVVLAKASHAGWPTIDGVLRVNRHDLDKESHGTANRHNELLGGHGNDVIHAGNAGDVIWGDYKPCCQPASQSDVLVGGSGKDFIYTSHGQNIVWTGGGPDIVHTHFGRGEIHCQSADATVLVSHHSKRAYRLFGCLRVRLG